MSGARTGIDLIAAERRRQVEAEGWTPGHDDEHEAEEMARAAALYAAPPFLRDDPSEELYEALWPWEPRWWKPTPKDRVRELVKAGALIAAEIDRLQRLAVAGAPHGR